MKTLSIILLTSLTSLGMYAQNIGPSTINLAGGSAVIGTNTYEWSIGEMSVVHTAVTPSLVVTHGVLQPIMSTVGIKSQAIGSLAINVFPNPSENYVFLETKINESYELSFQLFDVLGRLLLKQSFKSKSGNELHKIDLSSLVAGSYFLRVVSQLKGQQFVNNFEIKKTK